MPDNPPDVAEVLAEVNRLRAEHGIGGPLDTMPNGTRLSCRQCPVARALDALSVGVSIGVVWPTLEHAPLPDNLKAFVTEFDRGAYPELVA
jgi:hypothetical protein